MKEENTTPQKQEPKTKWTTIKEQLKNIPKNYSSRHGCFWCKAPLPTMKEKILRACNNCGKDTIQAFDKMATGNIKEGFTDVKKIIFGQSEQLKQTGQNLIKTAVTKRRKQIEKRLHKKGLTPEQIKQGLHIFDESLKE